MSLTILQGDWIERLKTLPDCSVHCVVTSPPYWGLRDYQLPPCDWPEVTFSPMAGLPPVIVPAMAATLGLEQDPLSFVAHIVLGFREVRRVLRDDGTLWMNWGDSYARNSGDPGGGSRELMHLEGTQTRMNRIPTGSGLKPKDLIGIPWRVAFALQADGWYLRQDIIWAKPNPMPESVTDRCTKSHEYLFLLSKQPKYFYDAHAIMDPVTGNAHPRGDGVNPKAKVNGPNSRMAKERTPAAGEDGMANKPNPSSWNVRQNASFSAAMSNHLVSQRNKRSVWTVATAAFKGCHYATFPPKLITPCILAGTSARGCCPNCEAPWARVVETDSKAVPRREPGSGSHCPQSHHAGQTPHRVGGFKSASKTTGWLPTCSCPPANPIPCVVLDCFAGSGTVGQVAIEHGRSAILIELSETSIELIRDRCNITPSLALW